MEREWHSLMGGSRKRKNTSWEKFTSCLKCVLELCSSHAPPLNTIAHPVPVGTKHQRGGLRRTLENSTAQPTTTPSNMNAPAGCR
jgi:hypothetical protein